VEEALSQLRLQPLVDTLHRTISETTIHGFAKAAFVSLTRELEVEAKSGKSASKVARKAKVEAAEVQAAGVEAAGLSEEVSAFVGGVQRFVETALHLASVGGTQLSEVAEGPAWIATATKGETAEETGLAEVATAAIRLPWMVLKFPEGMQTAARWVLPSSDVHIPAAQTWAPVMAWMALRTLGSPQAALTLYDALRLRHVFAEVFSAVGVHGEQAWREAAQVRVLLRMNAFGSCSEAVRSEEFWKDADARWLTGIHSEPGETEYFTQEGFEAFVCWLQLPALIAIGEDGVVQTKAMHDVTAVAANLAYAAKVAGYEVHRFLDVLRTGDLKERRELELAELSAAEE
jgi:hypothetical protein